jgi:hypothetical protein
MKYQMKKINDLYGKIGPKKGDVIIESMAVESFAQATSDARKRESVKSKGKLHRMKTTLEPSINTLQIQEMHTDESKLKKSGLKQDNDKSSKEGGLDAPPSSKKRRLSMEIPSAKKQIGAGRQFGNKPLFEQFKR